MEGWLRRTARATTSDKGIDYEFMHSNGTPHQAERQRLGWCNAEFHIEAAAYGHAKRSVKIEKRSEYLRERAEYLASNAYSHGRNTKECSAQILKKFSDGGLL